MHGIGRSASVRHRYPRALYVPTRVRRTLRLPRHACQWRTIGGGGGRRFSREGDCVEVELRRTKRPKQAEAELEDRIAW